MAKVLIVLIVIAALAVMLSRGSSSEYCGEDVECVQWYEDNAPSIVDR